MDTLPLPPRPSLEQYQKRAKDLVKAAGSADPDALRDWADRWVHGLAKSLDKTITVAMQRAVDQAIAAIERRIRADVVAKRARQEELSLADAQFFVASAHGFGNWAEFARHIGN